MKLKKSTRGFLFLVGALLVLAVLIVTTLPTARTEKTSLSQIVDEAKNGKVESIEVDGQKLTATLKDTSAAKQVAFKDSPQASLKDYGIDYSKVVVQTKN